MCIRDRYLFAAEVPPLFVVLLAMSSVLVASVVGLLRSELDDFKIFTIIWVGISFNASDKLVVENPDMPSPSFEIFKVTTCCALPFVIFCASEAVSAFVVFDTVDTALPVAWATTVIAASVSPVVLSIIFVPSAVILFLNW